MAQARGKRNFATSNPRVVMTDHRRLAVPVFQRPVRALLSSALILAGTPFGAELLAQDPPRATSQPATPAAPVDPKLAALKTEALQMVQARSKQVQEIVDMLFSFQELGFQEF